MTVEHVIPFTLMPAPPAERPASIDARLNLLTHVVEDLSSEIRLLRQDSNQMARALLGGFSSRVDSSSGIAFGRVETFADAGLGLRLFGEMDVTWQGQPVDLPLGRKARMLLAFLAVCRPGGREKNELIGEFWPDSPEARASNNLSIAVHQVRSWLDGVASEGRSMIAVRQARYSLQGACQVDVEDFRAAVSRARQASSVGEVAKARREFLIAVALYNGEFLASEPCEEWAIRLRRELAGQYVEAAKWLAREAVAMRAWADAIDYAERIRRADQLDEEAYQLLILAHTKSGGRARAMQAYLECEQRLADSLGLRPTALTLKLRDAARSD
jgi:DNA-binding SARP family transcriptional activator